MVLNKALDCALRAAGVKAESLLCSAKDVRVGQRLSISKLHC